MSLEDTVQDSTHYAVYQKQLNTVWSNVTMQQNASYSNCVKKPIDCSPWKQYSRDHPYYTQRARCWSGEYDKLKSTPRTAVNIVANHHNHGSYSKRR